MRNLWILMKTFNVLPTEPRFKELSNNQIDLMLYSLEEDNRQAVLQSKGLSVDSEHYDSTFEDEVWNKSGDEWDVLKDGHDADSIAQQVSEMTAFEDRENLASKFDSLEEYNDYIAQGGESARESEVGTYINEQIKRAEEKARELEGSIDSKGLIDDRDRPETMESTQNGRTVPAIDKEAIDESIALFEEGDDEYTRI